AEEMAGSRSKSMIFGIIAPEAQPDLSPGAAGTAAKRSSRRPARDTCRPAIPRARHPARADRRPATRHRASPRPIVFLAALAGAVVAWASAGPAEAQEGMLIARSKDKPVFVWKSKAALEEGQALLRAQADPSRTLPLLACAPDHGTRVVRADESPGSGL